MARRHAGVVLVLMVASIVGSVGPSSVAADGSGAGLPAGQAVAAGPLGQVEGRLDVSSRGDGAEGSFRADRTISFRFAKPFQLWIGEEPSGVQVALDVDHGRIYDPHHGRLVTVELSEIMTHRWMRHLVDMLDVHALVDPQRMPQLRKQLRLELHRGAPPPDEHGPSWLPIPPPTDHAECGDWFVLTPASSSLYRRVLGLGRVALLVGPRMGIPTEFRYYRCDGERFVRTVAVTISELAFNRQRLPADYGVTVPGGTTTVAASDLLLGMVIGRVALIWNRLKSVVSRLGRDLVPQEGR